MRKNITRVAALVLAAVVTAGSVGYTAFSDTETVVSADDNQETEKQITEAITKELAHSTEGVDKEETVYIVTDTNGNVEKQIVSDWIKNKNGEEKLTDRSDLDAIENVKTDAGYTENADGTIEWDAQGNDIYYKGTTDKELPVNVKITYYLDGKEISAADLAGKSGKVKIRFDYIPNQKTTVKVNGVDKEMYVPFTMLSGMILDNSKFTNIQASTGKVINDGDRSLVAGVGFAGLNENLAFMENGGAGIRIPDYFEVTADVEDFSLMMTVSCATAELLGAVSVDGVDEINGIKETLNKMTSAVDKLCDGTTQLKDGMITWKTNFVTYAAGIGELRDGVSQIDEGAGLLAEKSKEFVEGIKSAKEGVCQIAENLDGENGAVAGANALAAGADKLLAGIGTREDMDNQKDTTVAGAISKLDDGANQLSAGLHALQAGINDSKDENGKEQYGLVSGLHALANGIGSADKQQAMADAASGNPQTLTGGALAVDAGMGELQSGMKSMVSGLEEAIADNQAKMTQIGQVLEYISQTGMNPATSAVATPQEIEEYKTNYASLAGANQALGMVLTQMDEKNLDESIDALKKGCEGVAEASGQMADAAQKLCVGADALANGMEQVQAGADSLASGTGKLKNNMGTLVDGASQLSVGTHSLAGGINTLSAAVNTQLLPGLGKLYDGGLLLQTSLNTLNDGTKSALEGADKLNAATAQLQDGVGKLAEGAEQLDDGMNQFKTEAIDKFVDALDDVEPLLGKIDATVKAAKNYNVFSDVADGKSASVKFIYRSEGINS